MGTAGMWFRAARLRGAGRRLVGAKQHESGLSRRKRRLGGDAARGSISRDLPAFENLEPRLLLSADISPQAQSALLRGLEDLRDWAAGLAELDPLGRSVIVLDRDLASVVDTPRIVQTSLVTPAQDYLTSLPEGRAPTDHNQAEVDAPAAEEAAGEPYDPAAALSWAGPHSDPPPAAVYRKETMA